MDWPISILTLVTVTVTLSIVSAFVMLPAANLGFRRFTMIWIFALIAYLGLLMGTCAGLLQWVEDRGSKSSETGRLELVKPDAIHPPESSTSHKSEVAPSSIGLS